MKNKDIVFTREDIESIQGTVKVLSSDLKKAEKKYKLMDKKVESYYSVNIGVVGLIPIVELLMMATVIDPNNFPAAANIALFSIYPAATFLFNRIVSKKVEGITSCMDNLEDKMDNLKNQINASNLILEMYEKKSNKSGNLDSFASKNIKYSDNEIDNLLERYVNKKK